MLKRIADWAVLCPSTNTLSFAGKERRVLTSAHGQFEAFVERTGGTAALEAECFILKFLGTGGRAEQSNPHPAECWRDLQCEVWSINPPGYGGSEGPASLQKMTETARTAYAEIKNAAAGRPLLVTGNSLGTVAALYVAARYEVDGILLRNPPPLRELITRKHGWWNLGLSRLVAQTVPAELCSITNAARVNAPIVFVVSGRDRTVPPQFQRQIIDAHPGQNRVLLLADADHATPVAEQHAAEYIELLAWLREQVLRRIAGRFVG